MKKTVITQILYQGKEQALEVGKPGHQRQKTELKHYFHFFRDSWLGNDVVVYSHDNR